MEVRSHAKILKSTTWFVVLMTVLVGVAALFFALFRPVSYKAVVSFNVEFINRPATADYQYGAYYDLKAAEAYTQHLMSLFMTPAIIEEVYKYARVGYEIESLSQFTNRFKTKQYSSQNFAVIFKDGQLENAENLARGVQFVVQERAPRAVKLQDQPVFSVESLAPVIVEAKTNTWLALGVGSLVGFLLSLILIYLREYFLK